MRTSLWTPPIAGTKAVPKRTGRSRRELKSAIDFYRKHSGLIQDEHSKILHALQSVEYSEHTVHPLRLHLWSHPASPCTPSLDELEDRHKKWFSVCKLDMASAKESLDELKQIQDRVSDLWLRTGATLPTRDADQRVALEATQTALKHMLSRKDITTYLHTMALLIYSSRKALEYSAHLLSLWVHVGKTHPGDIFREMDTRQQVLWSAFALSYDQQTWNLLMACPWTVACALHLLAVDAPNPLTNRRSGSVPTNSEAMECTESDGGERNIRVLSGDPARPPTSDAVFAAVGSALAQRMLEGCFRLSVVRSENSRLVEAVWPFKNVEGQDHKRSLHINFVSDTSGHGIEEPDVIEMIRDYWKKKASSNNDCWLDEGFEALSKLADTSELSDNHLHMSLGRPKAHCECILAQHWVARRHLTNQVIPLIGTSSHVCTTCITFLRAVLDYADNQSEAHGGGSTTWDDLERVVPGRRYAFRLCMVPKQSPIQVKKRVANELAAQLKRKLKSGWMIALLEKTLRTARGEDVGSDSYRREPDRNWFLYEGADANEFEPILRRGYEGPEEDAEED